MKRIFAALAFCVLAFGPLALPPCVPSVLAAPDYTARQIPWGTWKQTNNKNAVDEVKAIQFLLRARGFYKAQPDGIYGAKTATAVKNFQRSRGLKADGIVGAQTFPKLVRVVKRGDRGDIVRAAQLLGRNAANHIGEQPYIGLAVDGIYGEQTAEAIEFYQSARSFPEPIAGLKFNGKVDMTTWRVMFGAYE